MGNQFMSDEEFLNSIPPHALDNFIVKGLYDRLYKRVYPAVPGFEQAKANKAKEHLQRMDPSK